MPVLSRLSKEQIVIYFFYRERGIEIIKGENK
jgi:hypothetical protein